MPELPEAETIARGLAAILPGQRVRSVKVLREDVVEGQADDFVNDVRGNRIEGVGRRGKNVVLSLGEDRRVVVNLGMTGRLLANATTLPWKIMK